MIPPALPSHLRDATELSRHCLRSHFHGITGERGDVGLVGFEGLEHVGVLRLREFALCVQVELPHPRRRPAATGVHHLGTAKHRVEHFDHLGWLILRVEEHRLSNQALANSGCEVIASSKHRSAFVDRRVPAKPLRDCSTRRGRRASVPTRG